MKTNSECTTKKSKIVLTKEIDDEFETEFGKLSQDKTIEEAITLAIASIPHYIFELFRIFCSEKEEDCKKFCVCINYSSRLFPDKRFHTHINKNGNDFELKTFCYKTNKFNYKALESCYDLDNPFVGLLEFFYDTIKVKEGKKDNFSMNKYLDSRKGKDMRKMVELNQKSYEKDVIGYLKKNFGRHQEVNYARYAAYLWIAGGDLNRVRIFDKNTDDEEEFEEVIIEFVSLIASNAKSLVNWKEFKENKPYLQYNIPIIGYDDQNGEKVICNVVIPSLVQFNEDALAVIQVLTGAWLNKIWQFENVILSRRAIVRSTIAQVMARNLSHNYGSHVLNHLLQPTLDTFTFKEKPYKCVYRLKESDSAKETYEQALFLLNELKGSIDDWTDANQKETAKKMLDKVEVFLGSVPEAKGSVPEAKGNVPEAKNIHSESLRQIVYLLNHIKCRVDYISDISFGAPMLQTTRNVYNDIFKELDRVSLLMNHISGLEEHFEYEINIKGTGKKLDGQNDLQVAIPNDVVGTHAFYNILENIIRNTAKHSNGQTPNKVVVFHVEFSNIDTKDFGETLNTIHFSNDNTEDEALKSQLKEEAQKLYCVEIIDTICLDEKTAEDLVNAQNKRLNEPVFEGERPRSHSLGLVEMEASAAYLRKFNTNVIDDEQFHVINKEEDSGRYKTFKDLYYNHHGQFNLLKAIMKPAKETGKYYFGYRFFMLRPQEVLIVGDDKTLQNLHKPQEGVWYIDKEDFQKDLGNGKVFNHEFVVYDNNKDSDIEKDIESFKTALSPRVLRLDIQKKWVDKETTDSSTIKNDCWKQWNDNNNKRWELKHFSCSYSDDENKDTAIYKHHLKDKQDKEDIEKCKYAEALSSAALNKLPRFHELVKDDNTQDDYILRFEEILEKDIESFDDEDYGIFCSYVQNRESVNNRILVIDERIQKAASKFSFGKGNDCMLPYSVYYEKMWVTVPKTKEVNLLEKSFDQTAKEIIDFVEGKIDKIQYDFVLIHYGILERIFKVIDNNHWQNKTKKFLDKLSKRTHVVVTSGRGVPGALPESVSFVSLSSVTSALIDYKSKYFFSCLMYAARKTTK